MLGINICPKKRSDYRNGTSGNDKRIEGNNHQNKTSHGVLYLMTFSNMAKHFLNDKDRVDYFGKCFMRYESLRAKTTYSLKINFRPFLL